MLKDLLKREPDDNIHAMAHADLGLMAGGFDGLEEVILPRRRGELDGMLDRLARGDRHFHRSVETDTAYSAHGHYCLGVLALGRAVDHPDAEKHLQHTRRHFSETSDSDRYPENLVRHANLYFGIARASQLSSNKLAHAADVIAEALAAGARMPTYLIGHTVEAFELAEEDGDLQKITEAIVEAGGDRALDELAACKTAVERCPALADRLHERAKAKGRTGADRAKDLRAALHGFLHRQDWKEAGEALDNLEILARDGVAVPEFLELLEKYDHAKSCAWDFEDVTIARARCHESRGEFEDATHVLRDLFFRLASSEGATGLSDAKGVLDRIRSYGLDESRYSDMTSRYTALANREAKDAGKTDPVVEQQVVEILVVGGEKLEARTENAIRETLKKRHSHVRARFIPTGWSGNWRRPFSEIEGQMEHHDALVIMRSMRTHLGREIRRTWDGPWRPCWGNGPRAIAEAVGEAAAAVRPK